MSDIYSLHNDEPTGVDIFNTHLVHQSVLICRKPG